VKTGDLVRAIKHNNSIGIVTEVFSDLNSENPWIRVLFTRPKESYQWVKKDGLVLLKEKTTDSLI
jgi:hypothetical protein